VTMKVTWPQSAAADFAALGRDTHLVRSNDIHDGRW